MRLRSDVVFLSSTEACLTEQVSDRSPPGERDARAAALRPKSVTALTGRCGDGQRRGGLLPLIWTYFRASPA